MIEILSPDQSTTKLITKIQACLSEGSKLGWLIDSEEEAIMIFLPDLHLRLVRGDEGTGQLKRDRRICVFLVIMKCAFQHPFLIN